MPHHRHMGQRAHPGRRRGRRRALLALAALGGGLGLTGCGSSVADASTTLTAAVDATVVHADGDAVAAVAGMQVDPGDVVRTGPAGRADLTTRSRNVYLGSQASLQVLDGAHEALRRGAVVVDAQHGPGLRLDIAGLTVTAADGSAMRAERSVTVRVGALAGDAHVLSAGGRSLTVPALHQVVTGGDALPDSTTPLRLTDDDGEAHAVPTLVRDDRALVNLARGIDGSSAGIARVVTASWHASLDSAPAGVARSERVLPVVIAAAADRGRSVADYRAAVGYRAAGGSWGVVAHLVGVPAVSVVDELAMLERSSPAGRIGDVRQVLAQLAAADGRSGSDGQNTGLSPGAGNGDGTGNGTRNGDGSGSGPQPSTSPTPSPSGPADQVTGTVDDTVGQVLSILPTPSPSPTGLLPSTLTSGLPLPVAP
jgi:hypothetical protein